MGTVVTGDVSTSLDHDKICADDVSDEIFDMAKPLDPLRITLADLLRCGVGDTIVTMLTDYNGFWQYDNRESFAEDDDESCNAAVWGKIHFAQSVGGIRQG